MDLFGVVALLALRMLGIDSRSCPLTCRDDCSCTPGHICGPSKHCQPIIAPGQQGCTVNEQCTAACEQSYCDVDTCLCKGGFAYPELALCYPKCPEGTHIEDWRCVRDNMKDLLFQNQQMVAKFQLTHTCGEVTPRRCDDERQLLNNTI